MAIEIVWGSGSGETELGAFDNALSQANIQNYNLVELSSVIPEGANIEQSGKIEPGRWSTGDLLAVVLASATSAVDGEQIAAGLGWSLATEGGVFMENHAGSREECRKRLAANIRDAKRTRDWNWNDDHNSKIIDTTVNGAGAVVVAAVFHPLSDGISDDDR